MEIKIQVPDKTAPGFLKRQRKALEFSKLANSGKLVPEDIDSLVDFLAEFVTEPVDREEAKAALWEASEQDFSDILNAISSSGQVLPKK